MCMLDQSLEFDSYGQPRDNTNGATNGRIDPSKLEIRSPRDIGDSRAFGDSSAVLNRSRGSSVALLGIIDRPYTTNARTIINRNCGSHRDHRRRTGFARHSLRSSQKSKAPLLINKNGELLFSHLCACCHWYWCPRDTLCNNAHLC